jgi:hypothetical protein
MKLPKITKKQQEIRGLMAEIWEYDDEDRPHMRFTIVDKLREYGVLMQEVWEEA